MAVNEDQVIEYLEGLNIVQLNDLVKKLEEKWDVKASSGAVMMAPAAAAGGGEAAVAAEPTEFNVVLADSGAKKIQVIKEVRAITGLGLKEAKQLVDECPSVVKESVSKDEADKMRAQLEEAGAKIEIKPAG